jgi:hypothetical protein
MSKFIFYTVFTFAFLIGGAIFLMDIFPFRLFYLAPLAFLLLPKYGLKIGNVEKVFFLFLIEIIASAIINGVSLSQILGFLRFIGIPYSMYYLCKNYINGNNIQRIIKLCIVVACLQPPLVLLQQTFFDPINSLLPANTRYQHEEQMDFSFGSFYISDDPAMSFFLMGLVIFLLFDNANNQFIKNRLLLAGYFTIGVLISNSQLSNILALLIWIVFFLRRFKAKDLIKSMIIASAALLLLLSLGLYEFLEWKIADVIQQASIESIQSAAGSGFEDGKYERNAAIYFYLTQPLKILGDGPSAYYDALNREFTIGNTGQIFTLYAEVGLLGLLMGYWIFYEMSRRSSASRNVAWGCFFLMSALTITTFVLSDASLILAYNIFLKTNLISADNNNDLKPG